MKNIAKMMLALLASVTMVAQVYAWDFNVSGSAEAMWNQTTTKANKDADALTGMDVDSSAGAITIKSSHTSGDSSASFAYKFEWDDDWDEDVSLSGSTKAGEWTASSSINFDMGHTGGGRHATEDAPKVAITNGVTTFQLGLIAPVSNQAVYSGSTAGGNVAYGRDDSSIGAYIDEYRGLGISHKLSDTMSVDVGIQMDDDNDGSILGEYASNVGVASQMTSFAVGISANVGPKVGFSYGSGSDSPKLSSSSDNKTTMNTMGLGVTMDLGGPAIQFTYGTYTGEKKTGVTATESKDTDTGLALSFTMPMGSDSIVASYTSVTQKSETGGSDTKDSSASGIEVGYNTKIGPVGLSIGYGTQTISADTASISGNSFDDNGTGEADGHSTQDLEVKMSYSF
jgi:hypothetical protein